MNRREEREKIAEKSIDILAALVMTLLIVRALVWFGRAPSELNYVANVILGVFFSGLWWISCVLVNTDKLK